MYVKKTVIEAQNKKGKIRTNKNRNLRKPSLKKTKEVIAGVPGVVIALLHLYIFLVISVDMHWYSY